MAKTNLKKRTASNKPTKVLKRPVNTLKKAENIIKHKEAEIEEAERKIKKLEEFEERVELKELHDSIKAIEKIVQYPSDQLNDMANHLIKKYKSEIGLATSEKRNIRLLDPFKIALWGKGPSKKDGTEIKKNLGRDVNSSVYKLFSDEELGQLSNKESFNSDGIKKGSELRTAILDWELALKTYEGLSEDARDVLKADISKLIHGEDVHFHKEKNKYDNIPHYALYYSNANQLSKGLKKYCLTMKKNSTQLSKAYNAFSITLMDNWNAVPLDEANLINDDIVLSKALWTDVQKMVDNLKNQ